MAPRSTKKLSQVEPQLGPKLAENIPNSTKSYKDYLENEIEENVVLKNITIDAILDIGGKLKLMDLRGLTIFGLQII